MVAIFQTGSSISTTLNYNERKVQQEKAECILAANYPMDHDRMTFKQKLNRLENQVALNENVTRNSVHISLNFDTSEQLSTEILREIAGDYMAQLGFSEQPYLVYRHHDAGHPHIHIVSVKIGADGRRIDTQNIGRNQSEKARKDIELRYGLVRAEDSKNSSRYRLEPVSSQRVQYGKMETKKAISNVLSNVLDSYKCASLAELNALLQLYNIKADRGGETSRMYKGGGLMFRALDEQGKKIGAPIKASQFWMRPTLKKLEQHFLKNAVAKQPFRNRLKNAIDLALLQPRGIHDLIKALEKEGISTVLRQSDTGSIYGITYVDHRNKVVFNGSEIGKPYSAKAILERCGNDYGHVQLQPPATRNRSVPVQQEDEQQRPREVGMLELLTQAEQSNEPIPYPLRKTKKKKRKRL